MISTGYKKQLSLQDKMSWVATKDEANAYTFVSDRIKKALEQREQRYKEFNDMTYLEDDTANLQIRDTYLRPKKNNDEVRVNTGTVEKKVMTVVNELNNLNMNHEIIAYDLEDKALVELGETISKIVKRTNEQEQDDEVRVALMWDLLTRRIAITEEYLDERMIQDKKVMRCRKRVIDSQKILFGDITIRPSKVNDQPYIVKYERITYDTAGSIYEDWDRWKYVAPGASISNNWYDGRYNWRLAQNMPANEVEVITYMCAVDNEYQIRINGVDMLPVGTKLPWEHEGYNIKVHCVREMGDFAYGQLFTVQAKVLAGVKDEMIRLAIRKFRQGNEPPIGTKKKGLTSDVFEPGAVTEGIGPDDFASLIQHTGVSVADFQMIEFISQQIEDEIGVSKLFQGGTEKKLTATQASEQMKQALKAIGLAVFAWTNCVRDFTYLRIYNVVENLTKPTDTKLIDGQLRDQFQQFTLNNTPLENERNGTVHIKFVNGQEKLPSSNQINTYEEDQAKVGNHVRVKFVDAEKLRAIPYLWHVVVTSQDKDSSNLNKVLFQDKLNQGVEIAQVTGRQLNPDKIIEEYERTWKTKDTFLQAQPAMPGQDMQDPNNPQAGVGGQVQDMMSKIQGMKGTGANAQVKQGQKGGFQKPGIRQLTNSPQ